MHVVIFAGGAGTRLWPLSRKATPKQFAKFFDGKSTLELAVERVADFGYDNIYISTNKNYVDLVAGQVPNLAKDHIFSEPAKRDLGAAVLLTLLRLKKRGVSGTVAMIWSDHLMERPEAFTAALKEADRLVGAQPERMVFIGERARYAEPNLGWINVGEKNADGHHAFVGWHYRPELDTCRAMFESGQWMWNPGYFVYDIDYVLSLYQQHQPSLYQSVASIFEDEVKLNAEYSEVEAIHFDKAIAEKIRPEDAVVIPVDMGWSDPGTLYAMKEALAEHEDHNVEQGLVVSHDSRDCLVYNEVDGQVVTTVGLDGVMVVNTKDGILVCHKDAAPDVKVLLERMKDQGLDNYL